MIELRWLIRRVPRPRGIDDEFYRPPLPDTIQQPVLQYRDRTPARISGNDDPAWIDVPVVEGRG